jgi:hypothetical protein
VANPPSAAPVGGIYSAPVATGREARKGRVTARYGRRATSPMKEPGRKRPEKAFGLSTPGFARRYGSLILKELQLNCPRPNRDPPSTRSCSAVNRLSPCGSRTASLSQTRRMIVHNPAGHGPPIFLVESRGCIPILIHAFRRLSCSPSRWGSESLAERTSVGGPCREQARPLGRSLLYERGERLSG